MLLKAFTVDIASPDTREPRKSINSAPNFTGFAPLDEHRGGKLLFYSQYCAQAEPDFTAWHLLAKFLNFAYNYC